MRFRVSQLRLASNLPYTCLSFLSSRIPGFAPPSLVRIFVPRRESLRASHGVGACVQSMSKMASCGVCLGCVTILSVAQESMVGNRQENVTETERRSWGGGERQGSLWTCDKDSRKSGGLSVGLGRSRDIGRSIHHWRQRQSHCLDSSHGLISQLSPQLATFQCSPLLFPLRTGPGKQKYLQHTQV